MTEVSPMEGMLADHPHYDCDIPMLEHPSKPRVGRGHRPGCHVAAGHRAGKVGGCPLCIMLKGGNDYYRKTSLRAKYGMSMDDYAALIAKQKGVCAICGQPPNGKGALHVDHDHATGAIRGLLCLTCNAGLGSFRDDPALLGRAVRYLRRALLGA
jgi:hypothetical protein